MGILYNPQNVVVGLAVGYFAEVGATLPANSVEFPRDWGTDWEQAGGTEDDGRRLVLRPRGSGEDETGGEQVLEAHGSLGWLVGIGGRNLAAPRAAGRPRVLGALDAGSPGRQTQPPAPRATRLSHPGGVLCPIDLSVALHS